MKTSELQLEDWHRFVAEARSRLAEAEADFTKEKSRVEAVHAGLFRLLRGHYQKRDRLRLAVDYRQKFLDSFVRDEPDEVEQSEKELQQARTQLEADYEKMAAAADKRRQLTAAEEAGLTPIWQKLVKLYHPGRLADEPAAQETHHQLTAAIHRAKHTGDTEMLRKIAENPESFQLQQGSATPELKAMEELARLKRLHETLQKEIAAVTESLMELHASPDYELYPRAAQSPGVLEELAAERAKQLDLEIAALEKQAEHLAQEIQKLSRLTDVL